MMVRVADCPASGKKLQIRLRYRLRLPVGGGRLHRGRIQVSAMSELLAIIGIFGLGASIVVNLVLIAWLRKADDAQQ
jgi:hypothetical protein